MAAITGAALSPDKINGTSSIGPPRETNREHDQRWTNPLTSHIFIRRTREVGYLETGYKSLNPLRLDPFKILVVRSPWFSLDPGRLMNCTFWENLLTQQQSHFCSYQQIKPGTEWKNQMKRKRWSKRKKKIFWKKGFLRMRLEISEYHHTFFTQIYHMVFYISKL